MSRQQFCIPDKKSIDYLTDTYFVLVQIKKTICLVFNLENVVGVEDSVKSLGNVRLDAVGLGHPLGVIFLAPGHVVKLQYENCVFCSRMINIFPSPS